MARRKKPIQGRRRARQPKTAGRRKVQARFARASRTCHAETTNAKAFGKCMGQEMRAGKRKRRKKVTRRGKARRKGVKTASGRCRYGKVTRGRRKGQCRKAKKS